MSSLPADEFSPGAAETFLADAIFRCEVVNHSTQHLTWGQDFVERTLYDKVYVITGGGGELNLNENSYILKPGMALLFPADLIQTGRVDQETSLTVLWTHFEAKTASGLRLLHAVPMPQCVTGATAATVQALMLELLDEWEARRPGFQLAVKSLLPRLLLTVCRAPAADLQKPDIVRQGGDPDPAKLRISRLGLIRGALECIASEYMHPLTLGDLAERANLSPAYFCNLFRELTGLPPMRYLERQRIRQAQELLRLEGKTVVEISASVGYTDPYHFSRVFRRVTGICPSAYRSGERAASA